MVTQIHYQGWPDHGVPKSPDSLIRLHNLVRSKHDELRQQQQQQQTTTEAPSAAPPVLVHCSAGVHLPADGVQSD